MGCSVSLAWAARRGRTCRWFTVLVAPPPSSSDFTTMSGVLSRARQEARDSNRRHGNDIAIVVGVTLEFYL